jgi:hypothetical protein
MNDEERAVLRKGFKLPDTATISEVKNKTFPLAGPLKVHIETILDPRVRELVTDGINEWNQKEAEKYGRLDVAPDRLQADVSVFALSASTRDRSHRQSCFDLYRPKWESTTVDSDIFVFDR